MNLVLYVKSHRATLVVCFIFISILVPNTYFITFIKLIFNKKTFKISFVCAIEKVYTVYWERWSCESPGDVTAAHAMPLQGKPQYTSLAVRQLTVLEV